MYRIRKIKIDMLKAWCVCTILLIGIVCNSYSQRDRFPRYSFGMDIQPVLSRINLIDNYNYQKIEFLVKREMPKHNMSFGIIYSNDFYRLFARSISFTSIDTQASIVTAIDNRTTTGGIIETYYGISKPLVFKNITFDLGTELGLLSLSLNTASQRSTYNYQTGDFSGKSTFNSSRTQSLGIRISPNLVIKSNINQRISLGFKFSLSLVQIFGKYAVEDASNRISNVRFNSNNLDIIHKTPIFNSLYLFYSF
jgi:hypothetical protein